MKRILIIEDNSRDFNKLSAFLKDEFPDVELYPTTEQESSELKRKIKALFVPNSVKRLAAEKYIKDLKFEDFDGIILDYELDKYHTETNGITLYNKLDLQNKTIILTKYTAGDFKKIEARIVENFLQDRVIAIQKESGNTLNLDQKKEYARHINSHLLNKKEVADLPIVVILTAIQEEYEAVRAHLNHLKFYKDRTSTIYENGQYSRHGEDFANIYIRRCGAGVAKASQETQRAITNFDPKVMFFVGIAGSRKPSDFVVGDVIIGNKIFSYEGGKATNEAFLARPDAGNSTYRLCEIAKTASIDNTWQNLGILPIPSTTKADIGVIASGDVLIESYTSEIGKRLTQHYNETQAVEMEGFAFASATSNHTPPIPSAVIRGISDVLKQENEIDHNISADVRPKNVKETAANNAAAFTFWLIQNYFSN